MKTMKVTAAAAAIVLLSACSYATKEEVTKLRNENAETRRLASQALNEADIAKADASEAKLQAQQSVLVSQKTEEVVNRSYKKSMYK